ncbi:MAG: hypothetical protein ABI721_01765 [Candidatus Dojkabacteria bacterium]
MVKFKSKLLLLVTGLLLGSLLLPVQKVSAAYSTSVGSQSIFSITSPEVNSVLPGRECNVSTIGGSLGEGIGGAAQTIVSNNWDAASCANAKGDTAGLSQILDGPSVLNSVGNVTAAVLNQRPGSGVDFIQEKVYAITNPGLVYASTNPEPSTYYPGAGSELLRPIQGFWGWSVNLVFGFLILLIIVIAFAIMFRQRLGGAAEVTLQNAIPSIALAMILIPLSYAISGLFIDAITLGTNAVHGFLLGPQSPGAAVYANRPNKDKENCDLQNTDLGNGVDCDRGFYADDPLIDVWRAKDRIDLSGASTTIAQGISDTLSPGSGGVSARAIFNFISSILNFIGGGAAGSTNQYAWFGNIVNIVIGLLTIWIAIQIFFKLIGKYLTLILFPAFSPFIFATAALPGNGTKSIVSYLKTMGSAALFYIVTYAMFLLTLIFTDPTFQNSLPDFRTSGYIPPLLGIQGIIKTLTTGANTFPLTQLILTLVGLGIYFSIPKTLDGIDEALGTKLVIPQLLKTPFESMQESFKITTRAFPSAAATVAKTTAGGVRGTLSTATNARFNVLRAVQRAQGIDDSDPRSVASQRRNANTLRRQKLLADLDKAGTNIPQRAAIQAQLSQLDLAEGLQGKEFSTKGEADKEREIKATFSWSGTEKFLIIKTSVAETWKKASRGGAFLTPELGELSIEAVNFTFPNRLNPLELIVGTVNEARNIGLPLLGTKEIFESPINVGGRALTLRKARAPIPGDKIPGSTFPTEEGGIFAPFKVPGSDAYIDLFISEDNSFNTDNGKKIKFKMKLYFSNTNAVFGAGTTLGILAPGQDVPTSKRAFKYGPYESNPVNAVIQLVKD